MIRKVFYSNAQVRARCGGVPLACQWMPSVEALMRAENRLVFVTSHHVGEHHLTRENLERIGANIVFDEVTRLLASLGMVALKLISRMRRWTRSSRSFGANWSRWKWSRGM